MAAALAGTRPLYRQQLPPTREELLQKMAPRGRNIKTEDSTNKNIRSFVPADLCDAFPEVASSPKIEELDISAVSVSLDGKHMNARKQTSNVVSNTNADPGSQQEAEGSTMSVGEQLAAQEAKRVKMQEMFYAQHGSDFNERAKGMMHQGSLNENEYGTYRTTLNEGHEMKKDPVTMQPVPTVINFSAPEEDKHREKFAARLEQFHRNHRVKSAELSWRNILSGACLFAAVFTVTLNWQSILVMFYQLYRQRVI